MKKDGQWVYATLGIVKEVAHQTIVLAIAEQEFVLPVTAITATIVQKMMEDQDYVMLPFHVESNTLLLEEIEVDHVVPDAELQESGFMVIEE